MGDHDVQAAMDLNRKWGLIRMVATGKLSVQHSQLLTVTW